MGATTAELPAQCRDSSVATARPVHCALIPVGDGAFVCVLAVVFAVGAAATVVLCRSMSAGMAMPGGWIMPMAWMRMPGQSWLAFAESFLGMWDAMTVTMMLPSLAPILLSYRHIVREAGASRLSALTALVGAGYFLVWSAIGVAVCAVGFAISDLEMRYVALSRVAPDAAGAIVVAAGALQFTRWKSQRLQCCRELPSFEHVMPLGRATALRHGLLSGLQCAMCCFGTMTIMVVLGIMDLRIMTVATLAISAERLMPNSARAARFVGLASVAAGLVVLLRAI